MRTYLPACDHTTLLELHKVFNLSYPKAILKWRKKKIEIPVLSGLCYLLESKEIAFHPGKDERPCVNDSQGGRTDI